MADFAEFMELLRETLLVIWTTPVYGVLILTELILSNWRGRPAYRLHDTLENVYLSILNAVIDLLMRGVALGLLAFCFRHSWVSIGPPWVYWLTLVVALDFLFWILHWVDHRCRLFWAVHVTHHSSDEFNLTTGFRSSVFQPLYRFVYFVPLPLFGFAPADILFVYAASQTYGVLLHTRQVGRLGILEWFLVTPSHHRVHHGSNPEYLDKNMGMVFIVWDRMFGTFQEEKAPVKYGITNPLPDRKPVTVVFHEWKVLLQDVRKAPTLAAKWRLLWAPPGTKRSGINSY